MTFEISEVYIVYDITANWLWIYKHSIDNWFALHPKLFYLNQINYILIKYIIFNLIFQSSIQNQLQIFQGKYDLYDKLYNIFI